MKCCYINKIWSGAVLEVIQGNRSLMVALAQQLLLIIFSLRRQHLQDLTVKRTVSCIFLQQVQQCTIFSTSLKNNKTISQIHYSCVLY